MTNITTVNLKRLPPPDMQANVCSYGNDSNTCVMKQPGTISEYAKGCYSYSMTCK